MATEFFDAIEVPDSVVDGADNSTEDAHTRFDDGKFLVDFWNAVLQMNAREWRNGGPFVLFSNLSRLVDALRRNNSVEITICLTEVALTEIYHPRKSHKGKLPDKDFSFFGEFVRNGLNQNVYEFSGREALVARFALLMYGLNTSEILVRVTDILLRGVSDEVAAEVADVLDEYIPKLSVSDKNSG